MIEQKISLVIPAYNEEKLIKKNLDKASSYLKKNFKDYEIIVVADGSTDKTFEIANSYKNVVALKNTTNQGKGFSVKKGVLKSKYPLVVFSDADLSTPISEISKLLPWINEGYDIVIGSRKMKGSKIMAKQSFLRRVIGNFGKLAVSFLGVRGFKDTQCGFKMFHKCAKQVFSKQKTKKWIFDVEILLIAKNNGYKIKEVPVIWINREESRLSPVKDSIVSFYDLIRIRINWLFGRY